MDRAVTRPLWQPYFFGCRKRLKGTPRNEHCTVSLMLTMPNKLQQLRKEQLRWSRPRRRGRRLSEKAFRNQSDAHFYGTLGPASPVKRIDPKTGEVIEVLNPPCQKLWGRRRLANGDPTIDNQGVESR